MWPEDEDGFFERIGASVREREAFMAIDRELLATSEHTNLIARATLPVRWGRHYGDSAQLWSDLPNDTTRLLDIGSGAGFPGLVLAVLASERLPRLRLTLVDSVGKKAAFLRRAAAEAGLDNVTVLSKRVEALASNWRFDVITARAVTALPNLLELCAPCLAKDGVMIFPKGKRAQLELDDAEKQWSFAVQSRPSETDPQGRILLIRSPKRIR